jgi:HemK-related putative methylase
MNNSIYSPEEDSYLMTENLRKEIPRILKENSNSKFLEIGSGSGINLKTLLEFKIKKQNIFSCDINPEAVKHCKKLGFNCIKSDLFKKIPKQKFDLIFFNPPYLPEDNLEPENSKTETTAGKKGNEIIIKFLKQAKNYLDKKGKIFIITSSLSEKINFKKLGYNSKIIDKKKLFFEELFLWKIKNL